MNINSVSKNECTACGSCVVSCPKECILWEYDEIDNKYPKVNNVQCVECGLCLKNCPANNRVERNAPKTAFAVWNSKEEDRRLSASGGVASAIYDYCQKNGYVCYGVTKVDNKYVYKRASEFQKASDLFRNSKYVYTSISDIFLDMEAMLREERKVCCIGLPCQIAAVKIKFGKKYGERLFLVDIICHGVCSEKYLEQHINNKAGKMDDLKILFRNPIYGTDTYHFTLENEDRIIYDKTPNSDDEYQSAYHKGISYRENCFNCQYTSVKRVGDLMISDYWGLGKLVPFEGSKKSVSLVYVCSKHGDDMFEHLIKENYVVAVERPIEESAQTQGQLIHPTPITLRRKKFVENYKRTKDFDKAINKAMKIDLKYADKSFYRSILMIRRIIRKVFKVEM